VTNQHTSKVSAASKLSPTALVEIWAWYQAKRELGTFKTKAREYGVTASALSEYIHRRRKNEVKQRQKMQRARMQPWRQMGER
jgi:hypothetical protein